MKRDRQLVQLFLDGYNDLTNGRYAVVLWPEDEDRRNPAVEAIARQPDGRTLAIEHTLLQAFKGDRADAQPLRKVFAPLEQDPSLTVPEYDVTIYLRPGVVPKGTNWNTVRQRVAEWLRNTKHSFPEGSSFHGVPNLPFTLNVVVEKEYLLPGAAGKLFFVRILPAGSLESVLLQALTRKLPKLAAAAADERVLLLEKDHTAYGYVAIGRAVESLESGFAELRDISAVWVVNTVSWETASAVRFLQIWRNGCTNRFVVNKEHGKQQART